MENRWKNDRGFDIRVLIRNEQRDEMIDTILFKIGWKKMHFRIIKIDKIAIYFVVSFYTNFYTRDVSWDICGIFDRV